MAQQPDVSGDSKPEASSYVLTEADERRVDNILKHQAAAWGYTRDDVAHPRSRFPPSPNTTLPPAACSTPACQSAMVQAAVSASRAVISDLELCVPGPEMFEATGLSGYVP